KKVELLVVVIDYFKHFFSVLLFSWLGLIGCGCFAFVVFSQALLAILLCHLPLETWDQIGFSDGAGVFLGVVEWGDLD
ncbi:hypothetical protein ACJBQZ_12580, partial [Streptococcus suis]